MSEPALPETSAYAQLSEFLKDDPTNPALLADTAEAAFGEGRFDEAEALLARAAEARSLPPEAQHLAGLTAMRRERWNEAAERFAKLMEDGADAPAVRFNLAWSLAMEKRFAEAAEVLDDGTADTLPQAAQLQVSLLHQLGDLDRAEARARALIERFPEHRQLNAAVATLAIDIEDLALARDCAARADGHPDALITLGTLALGEDDAASAGRLFEEALRRNPEAPRARIGHGLVRLLGGDKKMAAEELDKGAAQFGDHLGSWIAAGWAHVIAGDLVTAQKRFETALAIDDNFGEAQGSLAVMELMQGQVDEARRRTEIALRLDPQSFSAAFASMLLAADEGNTALAQRIFERALHTPVDEGGRTLAQALARMGSGLN